MVRSQNLASTVVCWRPPDAATSTSYSRWTGLHSRNITWSFACGYLGLYFTFVFTLLHETNTEVLYIHTWRHDKASVENRPQGTHGLSTLNKNNGNPMPPNGEHGLSLLGTRTACVIIATVWRTSVKSLYEAARGLWRERLLDSFHTRTCSCSNCCSICTAVNLFVLLRLSYIICGVQGHWRYSWWSTRVAKHGYARLIVARYGCLGST